jgi:ABC-type nitrate/sulfonate/bicarbonate transport system permease component
MKTTWRTFVAIFIFLVAWELLAKAQFVPAFLFPPPSRVFLAFVDLGRSGELFQDSQASLWRAVVGFLLGSSAGIGVALVTGRFEFANGYLSPIIQLLRPLPPVAIIPLVIIWFGIGEISKIFSIAFAVFFPVWINSHIGILEIPKTFLWSAQTYRISSFAVLWKVILPAALPFILAGLRTGIAIAFVMVYVSELAGASLGIGYRISVSFLAYRVDQMIAALALLGFCGAIADVLLTRLFWYLFPWIKFQSKK